MNIDEMRKKILSDRELVTAQDFFERDFSIKEVPGMATCIVGGRRTGKTSYLKKYARKLIENGLEEERICYLSFFTSDDMSFPFSLISDAYFSLYPEYSTDEVYFFLDEIEAITNWGGGVSYMMERYPKAHIFITGSSAKYLSSEIATELRGRSLSWSFYPLSFREFLSFNKVPYTGKDGTYSTSDQASLIHWFTEYEERSSYPALYSNTDKEIRKLTLSSYFDTVFSRDLIERYDVSRGALMKALLKRMIKNSGSPYTVRKLVATMKSMGYPTSVELISSYLDMITASSFMIAVPIYGTEKQIKRNDKKMYVIDHQMAVLFREFDKGTGIILEHIVLMELRRRTKLNIAYYRTRNDEECDFILYDDDKTPLLLIQVTDDYEKSKERELKGLLSAMEETGLKKGYIVTSSISETITKKDKEITVIPAWKFVLSNFL